MDVPRFANRPNLFTPVFSYAGDAMVTSAPQSFSICLSCSFRAEMSWLILKYKLRVKLYTPFPFLRSFLVSTFPQ
jgi:hypothetical protein